MRAEVELQAAGFDHVGRGHSICSLGGSAALVDATQDGPLYNWVIGLAAAGAILGAMLTVLMVRAFRERHEAEQRADAAMRTLISHMPDRFLPGTEDLVPVLATDNA